jgi:anti-sigma regulatory factor (Ser/Thr protein kinase)
MTDRVQTITKRTIKAPMASAELKRLHLVIPSRLSAVEPVCVQLRALLKKHELLQRCFAVEIAARECLNNAILHGSPGREKSMVGFAMRIGRKLIRVQITDQGGGFNWRRRRHREWPAGSEVNGRGLIVSGMYAQRMVFNRRGNQVTLWINTGRGER